MCFLHHRPDHEEYDYDPEYEAAPRSCPRLAWAVPVDAAELGASLEAFEALMPQVQTLRLCHRDGRASLSTLPQEILDLIIGILYRSTRKDVAKRWNEKFRCFQGRCVTVDHLKMDDEEIEGLFTSLLPYQDDPCCDRHRRAGDFNSADYEIAEKRDMVEEFINKDGDWAYDSVNEVHDEEREDWLDMLCLCEQRAVQRPALKTFLPFQEILRSQFGLEAVFLHETFSPSMITFLPDAAHGPAFIGYYTSCFLVLPKDPDLEHQPQKRTEKHGNQTFLKGDVHLAFHQKIDLTTLAINDKERLSFSRVLRILELDPSFHLTELETTVASPTTDDTLSKISEGQLADWPPVSSAPNDEKTEVLREYLRRKREEVGNQQWPQFMMMATSDAVAPIPVTR